jgi:glc operon protein GlcG
MNVRLCLTAAAVAVTAGTASAQVLPKPTLTLEGARRVIAAAMAEARAKQAPGGVFAVVDDGGNLMALERLDNTFAAGANISIGKARTAALFKRPTRVFEDIIKNGRTSMVALNDFTPLQGGVPIVVDGQIVGAIGVSGAASAQQDDELAIAGANAFAHTSTAGAVASSSPVGYFPAPQVAASFAKGAVLVDDSGGRNYMVHTSRRDKAGQAEIHLRDTDIIYILQGTTTFVTGGKVVDGRSTAADEIRGSAIEAGETRTLTRGDVIVVPHGTPHWFKQVDGPVEYYVVKVRAEGAMTMAGGAR